MREPAPPAEAQEDPVEQAQSVGSSDDLDPAAAIGVLD